MPTQTFTKSRVILPIKIGMNGVTIANGAPVTSNPFSIDGYNQLTLDFELTWVAATSVTAYVEVKEKGSSVWKRTQTKAIAAGTETMSPRLMSQAVASSEKWRWEFGGINGDLARVVVEGVAGTTDTIKVTPTVGVV